MVQDTKWWHNTVVYQVYPRSFQDSNGDGIGDLQGIINRLPYLQKLGIGAMWLSPVYSSPNDDNGYDIADYRQIMKEFGTMDQMDELIKEAKKRDIRVIMDLVVNHTSDENAWFIEAKKSKDNQYRDYYIWRDPVDGKAPNDLTASFSSSAWTFDQTTKQYYLHLFSKKQPDLNWENPKLRQEIYSMMNFWLAKGIGGFRMDVIDLIGKEPDKKILANGPKLHDYLQEMNANTFGNQDVLTVGEAWSASPERAKLYSDPKRKELSMVFEFENMVLDQEREPTSEKWDLKELDLDQLKAAFAKWQTALGDDGWNSLFWNNHDLPRIVSRWGNDGKYRIESAKMLAILLHLMKGTPYIYQGEEIGMTNYPISGVDEIDDIESINMYHDRIKRGYSKAEVLKSINTKGRDNARTPMQWDETENGGFTTGKPWFHVNPNYKTINVKDALADSNSIFYTYQKLIQLRRDNPVIVYGTFDLITAVQTPVFAYLRTDDHQQILVVANFSNSKQTIDLSEFNGEYPVLIHNYSQEMIELGKQLLLQPYEAFAIELTRK